jgi:hypothetical protein
MTPSKISRVTTMRKKMRTMALSDENYDKIIGALRRADIDQLLGINRYSVELIRLEHKRRNREAIDTLEVGMRVMYPELTKPKYLARQLGTVVEVRDAKVVVKLDRGPQGKFRSGLVITPAGSLVVLQNQPKLEDSDA